MKVTLTLLFLTSLSCYANRKHPDDFASLDTLQLLEGRVLEKPAGMRTERIRKEMARGLRPWPSRQTWEASKTRGCGEICCPGKSGKPGRAVQM